MGGGQYLIHFVFDSTYLLIQLPQFLWGFLTMPSCPEVGGGTKTDDRERPWAGHYWSTLWEKSPQDKHKRYEPSDYFWGGPWSRMFPGAAGASPPSAHWVPGRSKGCAWGMGRRRRRGQGADGAGCFRGDTNRVCNTASGADLLGVACVFTAEVQRDEGHCGRERRTLRSGYQPSHQKECHGLDADPALNLMRWSWSHLGSRTVTEGRGREVGWGVGSLRLDGHDEYECLIRWPISVSENGEDYRLWSRTLTPSLAGYAPLTWRQWQRYLRPINLTNVKTIQR